MSKKNDLLARASAVTSHAQTKIPAAHSAPAVEKPQVEASVNTDVSTSVPTERSTSVGKRPRTATVRKHPVRLTVDLSPNDHLALKSWCATASAELSIFPVPASDVVRALLAKLHSDPALAASVREDIARRVS